MGAAFRFGGPLMQADRDAYRDALIAREGSAAAAVDHALASLGRLTDKAAALLQASSLFSAILLVFSAQLHNNIWMKGPLITGLLATVVNFTVFNFHFSWKELSVSEDEYLAELVNVVCWRGVRFQLSYYLALISFAWASVIIVFQLL